MKKTFIFPALIMMFILTLCAGCSDTPIQPCSVTVTAGNEQRAFAGEKFTFPIRATILGEVKNLTGHRKHVPCPKVKVKIYPAPGSDLEVLSVSDVSDDGGEVSAVVRAGKTSGDQYLIIQPEGKNTKPAKVRLITGLGITGDNSETIAGDVADKPISVKVTKQGKPVSGVPVRFELRATSEGIKSSAKILSPSVETDKDGIASTQIRVGKKPASIKSALKSRVQKKASITAVSTSMFSDSTFCLSSSAFWAVLPCSFSV